MISINQVKSYCKDYTEIENYDKAVSDKTQIWDCHHRREIEDNKTPEQLINESLYYNRPPEELIFLTHGEHSKLHNTGHRHYLYGKHLSMETKKKMSEAYKRHNTAEYRKKLSEARKGIIFTEEHKRKISESVKSFWKNIE